MPSELLKRAEVQHARELPFVLYRKPMQKSVIGLFQKDAQLHNVHDFSESGFVFAPFDADGSIILLQIDERMKELASLEQIHLKENTVPDLDGHQRDGHIDLIKKAIQQIHESDLQKVVLSRRVDRDCSTSPIHLFQKLLAAYDNALCYIWYHPKVGLWLGATPEILLHGANNRLTTMSLAGTQQYEGEEHPKWGAKEREEQQLVTDYISEALRAKVNNLKISEPESFRAGSLLHLRTRLSADYAHGALSEIVKSLHPTPAVCGMPLVSSRQFILKNENYDREFYTGYLGELNLKSEITRASRRRNKENKAYRTLKSSTTFFVNLRCMQLKDDKAYIYVGGGLTKDSVPEREWQETVAKTHTMLKVLTNE